MTHDEILRTVDKNIGLIAKYFNISPMEIWEGDYHFYIHQYNLANEDEYEENKHHQKPNKVDSLFDAF